jgi:hypothetical protein
VVELLRPWYLVCEFASVMTDWATNQRSLDLLQGVEYTMIDKVCLWPVAQKR